MNGNRTIFIEPLTRQAYAPFGDVIDTAGAGHFPINAGMTERYHDLARVEVAGPGARVLVSIARGKPYTLPLTLSMVERHPLGSQAFHPLSDRPFLTIVAPDEDGRPGRPRAFRTAPGQGINMLRGCWHAVLTPLGAVSDYLVIDRGGDGANLEEFYFDEPYIIAEEQ